MTANTAKTKSASTLTVPCAVTTAPWWMCQAFADLKRGVLTDGLLQSFMPVSGK